MTVTERPDQHDKPITAIRDLVKEGIKMVLETRRVALETRKDLRKLAAMQLATAGAQKRTDESLQALIGTLRGGGNGHTKDADRERKSADGGVRPTFPIVLKTAP